MKITSINLIAPIALLLSLWLGFTDRIDWWVIILIWLMKFHFTLKLK